MMLVDFVLNRGEIHSKFENLRKKLKKSIAKYFKTLTQIDRKNQKVVEKRNKLHIFFFGTITYGKFKKMPKIEKKMAQKN